MSSDFIRSIKPFKFGVSLFYVLMQHCNIHNFLLEFPDIHGTVGTIILLTYFGFAVDKRDKSFVSEMYLIELNKLNPFELRMLQKSEANTPIILSALCFVFC